MAKKVLSAPSNLKPKTGNPQSLRVLIIEDSEDDALLIIRELKKGGYNPVYERVETATAMKKALKEKQWDVILCDYKLPKFNAPSAIAVLKETNIDIPIIIVSGTIGEETAVECMQLGAQDYIMKNNLSRLCPAISRELEETEVRNKQKQAEETLKEAESRFRNIFESSKDGIIFFDEKTQKIILGNTTMAELLGCSKEDLAGRSIQSLHPSEEWASVEQEFQKHVSGKTSLSAGLPVLRNDGSVFYADISSSLITLEGRSYFSAFFRDITERKRAEEELRKSEEKYRTILESIEEGYYEADIAGNLTFFNDSVCRISGHTREESMGINNRQYTDEYNAKKIFQAFNEVYRTEKPAAGYDYEIIRKDGTKAYVAASISLRKDSAGKKIGFRGIIRDITERKRAEEALRKSEESFRLSLDDSPLGVRIVTAEGETLYANQATLEIYGYDSIEDLIETPLKERYTPESYAEFKIRKEKRGRGELGPSEYEISIVRKNGEVRHVQVFRKEVWWNGARQFQIIYQDITERKQAEEELFRSQLMLQLVLDNIPQRVFWKDRNYVYLGCNKSFLQDAGVTSMEEIIGKDDFQLSWKKAASLYRADDKKVMKNNLTKVGYEEPQDKPDGSQMWLRTSKTPLHDRTGHVIGILGTYEDITEQKQAAAILKESEERFRLAFDNANTGMCLVDLEGNLTKVNNNMCEIFGYTKEELEHMTVNDIAHPDDIGKSPEFIEKTLQREIDSAIFEKRYFHKKGYVVTCEVSSSLVRKADDSPLYFISHIHDITKRKQAEEALRENEERYRRIVDNLLMGIGISCGNQVIFANPALLCLFGYNDLEEFTKLPLLNHVAPASHEFIVARMEKIAQGKPVPNEFEYDILRKDGLTKTLLASSQRFTLGGKVYTQTIFQDITERKQADSQREAALEELRESEEKYRLTFASTSDIIFTVDSELKVSNITPSVEKILGYRPEELMNKYFPSLKIMTPESLERAISNVKQVLSGIEVQNAVYDFITKDGLIGIGEVTGSPITQENKIIGVTCVARDITERKRAEEELSKRTEELQTIIEASPIMIYFKDTENRFIRVNKALAEITGLAKEEIEGKSNEEINPNQAAKLREEDKEIIATGKPKIGILETIKTRRGSIILQTDKVPYKDKDGKIIGIVGFSVDITEQKKAQEELLRSEEKYRSLVENAQEGIFQSTAEGRHLTINPAFARMLGYDSPQEVMQTITDIAQQLYVNPQDREKLLGLVEEEGSVTDFETEFYRKDGSSIWVSVNMHAVRDDQGRILYYQGIDQDITEKKKIEAERQENIERLRKSLSATINAMAVTVETRDPYTAGHQRRVADLARAIAVEMNLRSDQIDGVRMASMIHDIGKISIPSEILTKPTQLTNLEFNLIKTHPASGYNILKDIEFPWPIARIIMEHHERIDGSGYPNGLKGEQILLESRIIAIADVVEAISSHRPYRAAFGIDAGLDEITKNRGILYDPDLVDACLRLFREKNYNLAA